MSILSKNSSTNSSFSLGGYHLTNTARYWTYLTSIICGLPVDDDIPDHKYFLKYGPGYELRVERKPIKDLNEEAVFVAQLTKIQGMSRTSYV